MDAKTTYEVGRARHKGVGKCCFRTRCCWPCSFMHGGFLCYAANTPNFLRCLCCRLRALNKNRDRDLQVSFDDEPYCARGEIRQFTMTNLNSYGAGMALYDAKVLNDRVSPKDWKLEVFTRGGPFSVIGMTTAKKLLKLRCGSIPIVHQPGRVEMKLQRGEYFQMDGEPWLLNVGCTAIVEPNMRVLMLCPVEHGPGAGVWDGVQRRSFWEQQLRPPPRRPTVDGVELPSKSPV